MSEAVYFLGPAPAGETCAQVGDPDYAEKAALECRQYIAAIRMVCGNEPPGARLKVQWSDHDFGRYAEVVVAFNPDDPLAAEYAARCDEQAPTEWAAAGMEGPEQSTPGKRYVGRRDASGAVSVRVIPPAGEPYDLPPRLDLRNHSPTGFSWGYSGSGPAQLALALASDVIGDDDRARLVYQTLKSRVVGNLQGDAWELNERDLRAAIAQISREKGNGWRLS